MRSLLLLAPLALASCKTVDTSTSRIQAMPPSAVLVVLTDGTKYELDRPSVDERGLCGLPTSCEGGSCGVVEDSGCVSRAQIAALRERKVDGAAAAGITAALAGGIGAMTLVVANRRELSNPPSPPTDEGNIGSCPHAYSWTGSEYRLDSGTYGLSYFAAAPRTDFDDLDFLAADHGVYRLRLANEEPETEHTDLVRLHVVDHPEGTLVVPDEAGNLHTFRDERAPLAAHDFRGADVLELVGAKDGRAWSSDLSVRSALRSDDARDGVRLAFWKPPATRTVKLRLAAHNTKWAGEMLGYLLEHLGSELPRWFAQMNASPGARADFLAFVAREGMLHVRVKTRTGWTERAMFWPAGPEIVKDEAFVLPIDDAPEGPLEIELESATDFWRIDAASVAYEADEPVIDRTLTAHRAVTIDGRDVAPLLAKVDGQRFDANRGDIVDLEFRAPSPPLRGLVRSFVLETTGYDVPSITPAPDADPRAMATLMKIPFAASRLALALDLAH